MVISTKDKKSKSPSIGEMIEKAVKLTLEYMGDKKNALKDKKDNLQSVSQILSGLVSLA